jgi:4'-phosphopantetheinyl transferase
VHPAAADSQPVRIDIGRFELWLCELDAEPCEASRASLDDDERRKAARFVFERDRRRYVAAHAHLRALLANRTGLAAQHMNFEVGEFGKPSLRNVSDCAFNMSHSENVAAVLIARGGELGVDIEVLRPMRDALALAERNFSRSENAELLALPEPARDHAFLAGWTRKEACLKAVGSGLSIAPDTFTVGLGHEPASADISTPRGPVRVRVVSFCHEDRLLIACAELELPA